MNAPAMDVQPNEGLIRVLLVEDDERLASLTRIYLEKNGVVVTHAADGHTGLASAIRDRYDVILLDLMLPGMDGMSVCRQIRLRCNVPVIVVTARGEEADRVLGLETGADDYVMKPFSPRELLARINALVRRMRGRAGPADYPVSAAGITVDPQRMQSTLRGRPLALTTREFALLRVLVEHAGRVLTRDQLLDLANGSAEDAFERSVDVSISRLRRKLGDDPRHPRLLKTVRGTGYMLATGDEE
jgi:two-component system, OmpR family, response regulator